MTVTETRETKKRKHDDESSSMDPQVLHVVVRRVGKAENESLVIELDSDACVQDLKEKIAETLEELDEIVVPVERQRLIFSGKMLRDDSLLLEADLNMKAGDDHKHFVHLSPLPKGAAPSVRTERELAENSMSPQEATLQRARARQRRRRQETRLSDPAAYHPYALDLTSRSLMPVTSRNSAAASPFGLSGAPTEAALLSVAAAAEQSRLVQDLARRSVLPDAALQAMMLAQQHQSLLAAAAGGRAAAFAASVNPFCPLSSQADNTAASLLESALLAGRSPSASAMLQFAYPQMGNHSAVAAAAASLPSAFDPSVHALQDLLGRPRSNEYLPEILDQIAWNAGELATTLRLLGPGPAAAGFLQAVPTPVTSSGLPTSTPQGLRQANQLGLEPLEDRIANWPGAPGSFLPGSFPGFF